MALEADVTGGRVYDEARITGIGGDWRKYPFTLKPSASDPLARLAILVTGAGSVWMDQASLIPGDAVDDVRADVLEKVRALGPAFVRWPGGNVRPGLPLALGSRTERRPPDVDQPVLEERARAQRLRHR